MSRMKPRAVAEQVVRTAVLAIPATGIPLYFSTFPTRSALGDAVAGAACYLAVALAVRAYLSLFPRECPRCGHRGVHELLTCHYKGPDVWGNPGGSYALYDCPCCGRRLIEHMRGWDELPGGDYVRAAEHMVFGRTADTRPSSSTHAARA